MPGNLEKHGSQNINCKSQLGGSSFYWFSCMAEATSPV